MIDYFEEPLNSDYVTTEEAREQYEYWKDYFDDEEFDGLFDDENSGENSNLSDNFQKKENSFQPEHQDVQASPPLGFA